MSGLEELRQAVELVEGARDAAVVHSAHVIAGMLSAALVIIEAVVEVMEESTSVIEGPPS